MAKQSGKTWMRVDRRTVLTASMAAAALGALRVNAGAAAVSRFFLTDGEARFLTAACDILIPRDADPSASEAGVVDYIDLQLATGYGAGEGLYLKPPFTSGAPQQGWQLGMTPAAMMRTAIAAVEAQTDGFADLDETDQVAFLMDLEQGGRSLDGVPSERFFAELWSLTNEGYFADPAYNGNRDYAGWVMVGFPGAHAYYLGNVDDWNTEWAARPRGIAHRPGVGSRAFLPHSPRRGG